MIQTHTVNDTVQGRLGEYIVELDFFSEHGERRCFGSVCIQIDGREFTGSFERVYGMGTLEDMDWSPAYDHDIEIELPDDDINQLVLWAQENGY